MIDYKSLFPLFSHYPDIVYMDNASTTQKPQAVLDAIHNYTTTSYANIHRGQYALAEQSELHYHQTKKTLANFIGWDYREIVYTYNATHASNILAQSLVISYGLREGDTVLLGMWDHHATIVTWQLLAQQYGFHIEFIPIDTQTFDIDRDKISTILTAHRVRIVVCSHVSNVTGRIYDIKRLWTLLGDSVFFAIDGSQAVPHFRINVRDYHCQAYFFTGHKMMGPTGIGVLWIDKLSARQLQTLQGGGGIIESVHQLWCSLVRTADKFEPGTPNLMGAIGLAAACEFYETYGVYEVLRQQHQDWYSLYMTLQSQLWTDQCVMAPMEDSVGICSLRPEDANSFGEKLAQQNICVRVGGHCAHPLLQYLSWDAGTVRISPFVYTTASDLQKLYDVVASLSL